MDKRLHVDHYISPSQRALEDPFRKGHSSVADRCRLQCLSFFKFSRQTIAIIQPN